MLVAGYAIFLSLLASLALTALGLHRHTWVLLFLASGLALLFCVPEAPAVGFFTLALPMLQFAAAVWHLLKLPAAARALVCAAAATVFITQVPPVVARVLL